VAEQKQLQPLLEIL